MVFAQAILALLRGRRLVQACEVRHVVSVTGSTHNTLSTISSNTAVAAEQWAPVPRMKRHNVCSAWSMKRTHTCKLSYQF